MLRACGVQQGVAFGNTRSRSCKPSCQQHNSNKLGVRAQQGESSGAEGSSSGRPNALTATVKRKQKQLADLIQELGMEMLEERLQSGTASPARPPHRFVQLIQVPGDNLHAAYAMSFFNIVPSG